MQLKRLSVKTVFLGSDFSQNNFFFTICLTGHLLVTISRSMGGSFPGIHVVVVFFLFRINILSHVPGFAHYEGEVACGSVRAQRLRKSRIPTKRRYSYVVGTNGKYFKKVWC